MRISDWSSDVCSSDLLRAQGERFARQFDADAYRVLSESLDLHQVDPRQLHTSLHLLAIDQDRLVPRADIQSLARVTGASFTCLSSEYGHDAFLKEPEAVGDWLAARSEEHTFELQSLLRI